MVIGLAKQWELGHQLSYHQGNKLGFNDESAVGSRTNRLYTAIVRPMYKWNDTMRTVFEAGYYHEKKSYKYQDRSDKEAGTKFTVAQAWAMGDSFWSRPELRVYGSYVKDIAGATFGEKGDSDFVFGLQVEAWW